ncbi:MAG: S1/P1 nuclease [Rhodoferax sp.]|nr:S1/P1 nuclease [Rhodoferax sp.]
MSTILSRLVGYASLATALCMPLQALSWGVEGHQVIAKLAEAQLTPQALEEVHRLLELEPGSTMVSISTWADEHRNPTTAAWHYVNFPRGTCSYDASRDCPDGKCVVAAIERQAKILGSPFPDDSRLLALKYIIHFVGDIHQPLHAGYGDDRGGNNYQLQAFMRGSNLHAVWDTGLIKNLNEDVATLTERLATTEVLGTTFNAAKVAEESCHIVATPDFYPDRLVDAPYIEKFTPVMEQQLTKAGARLAILLNQLLR